MCFGEVLSAGEVITDTSILNINAELPSVSVFTSLMITSPVGAMRSNCWQWIAMIHISVIRNMTGYTVFQE